MTKLGEKIHAWDVKVSGKIAAIATASKRLEGLFAKSGNAFPWALFCLVCFIFDFAIPRIDILIQWFAMLATLIVSMTIKFSLKRTRPVEEIPAEFVGRGDVYSFPSGHAGRMATLAACMMFFYPITGWIFILWAFIVGYGRIAVKVHYFVDIVGGTIVGGTVGSIFYILKNSFVNLLSPFVEWIGVFLF